MSYSDFEPEIETTPYSHFLTSPGRDDAHLHKRKSDPLIGSPPSSLSSLSMAIAPNSNTPLHEMSVCRRCSQAHPDLRLLGCSCLLHARCTPLSLIVDTSAPFQYGGIPTPMKRASPCPICKTGALVTGIQLFPMSFNDLDRAMDLRRQCAHAASKAAPPRKRTRDEAEDDGAALLQIQAESSFLLLSHTRTSDRHQNQRTGRWSTDEVQYCDALLAGFDQSLLPLPHGVKLNEFLGDMLMCKSSRLTKKMKNAKLSTRSFSLSSNTCSTQQNNMNMMRQNNPTAENDYSVSLSSYQTHFLESIPSEPMQLELRFNMTKLWRTHFSNLCLQVGYDLLDARGWLASLEEMEQRASEANDVMRKARRKRMGLALKQDVGERSNAGVFIGGMSARTSSTNNLVKLTTTGTGVTMDTTNSNNTAFQQQHQQGGVAQPAPVTSSSSVVDVVTSGAMQQQQQQQAQVTPQQQPPQHSFQLGGGREVNGRPRTFSEDFSIGIEDFLDPLTMVNNNTINSNNSNVGDCGPFLDKVIHYIETENLPFQHVDVWVPSFLPDDDQSTVRLFPAGHATRADVDSGISYQLHEYGVYSTNFSFAPGVGLPGRVYTSGKASWECQVCDADPHMFERAGGARVYGVKTAVGIPMETPAVGRIILALYSTQELAANEPQMQRFAADFAKWTPEPKWKLVIELGDSDSDDTKKKQGLSTEVSNSTLAGDDSTTQSVRPPPANNSALSAFHVATPASSHNNKPLQQKPQEGATTRPSSSLTTTSVLARPSPVAAAPVLPGDEETEQRIASLLGDHMPLTEATGPMLQHYMSLRLLLLRSDDRRSIEEKGFLDVIKRSFLGYSKSTNRTDGELANLIARDWMFLCASSASSKQSSPQQQQQQQQHQGSPPMAPIQPPAMQQQQQSNPQQPYQCHVMSSNNSLKTTTNGLPTTMPATLLSLQQHGLSNGSLHPPGTQPQQQQQQHNNMYQQQQRNNNNNNNNAPGAATLIHRRHSSFGEQDVVRNKVSEGSREVSPVVVPES